MKVLGASMSNMLSNEPLPGNEKKAAARRRQRANKPPKPSALKLISESIDRGDSAAALLGIIYVIFAVIACIGMFVMFLSAL